MAIDRPTDMPTQPTAPIHHAPKESPRKRGPKPTVDRLATHRDVPETVAEPGTAPETQPNRRSHALDFAHVPAKIVVTAEGAVMATPDGVELLPDGDAAHALPIGARIEKRSDHEYRSTQLNAVRKYPDTTHQTAVEAIFAFVDHFHPRNG